MDEPPLRRRAARLLGGSRLLGIIASILLVMAVAEPFFFSVDNLLNILSNASINGILAVGMTMLMISGAFDISIGSIMVLAGVIAVLMVDRCGPTAAILVGVGSGIVMGLVNGILVAKLKINSFIATLGTTVIFQGIAFVLTDTRPIATGSEAFQRPATLEMAGIPAPILYFGGLAAAVWLVLNCTRVGKYAYAIGGNEDACRMLGIDVAAYRILLFVISGVCASFAGVLLSSRLGAASGAFAENRALVVIAAIVLGGVARGQDAWMLELHKPAAATASVTGDAPANLRGVRSVCVDLRMIGTEAWHVRFEQFGVKLRPDQSYTATWWAKADVPGELRVGLAMGHAPWQTLGREGTVQLGTGWQAYRLVVQPGTGEENARLVFDPPMRTGRIWLAGISLRPGGVTGLLDDETLQDTTVAGLSHN
jgi:ribose transport system permease protein